MPNPTDSAPAAKEPWRDPTPKRDARRIDDFVAAELAAGIPTEDDVVVVRRRGEPMPPTRTTPEWDAWLRRRAAT